MTYMYVNNLNFEVDSNGMIAGLTQQQIVALK